MKQLERVMSYNLIVSVYGRHIKDYFAALKLIDEKFDSAKSDCLAAHKDELTSRAFWEKVYKQKSE